MNIQISNIYFLIFHELSISPRWIYVRALHGNRLNITLRARSGKEVKLVITYWSSLFPVWVKFGAKQIGQKGVSACKFSVTFTQCFLDLWSLKMVKARRRNNINPCLTNRSSWWRLKGEERDTQSQWNDWRRKQRSMRRTLWGRHPTAPDHCDCIIDMVELWKTRTTRDWPYGIKQWQILI